MLCGERPACCEPMRIYLDHNATTPLRDEVVDAMAECLRSNWGNPSSTHAEGAAARAAIERARTQVAELLSAEQDEIFFTGGATEANNAILQGLLRADSPERQLVTTTAEHPSVGEVAGLLEAAGVGVTRVGVDPEGRVDPLEVEAAIGSEPALVSVIWANNETGVLQDVPEIARRVVARGARLHVDATQALGKLPIDLSELSVSLLSCSAHKLNGPKGVGALVDRSERGVPPLLHGGGQERRWRGGTENVAGIVGFGVACELARLELPARVRRYAELRDRLWHGIEASIPRVRRNGRPGQVLANTLNVEFEGAAGEVLLQALDVEGVAVSAGAACHSGSISPSHVLSAMGRSAEQARASLRLSVGHGVDEAQVDQAVELLTLLVKRTRGAVAA
jgi:cysteine desulfurase